MKIIKNNLWIVLLMVNGVYTAYGCRPNEETGSYYGKLNEDEQKAAIRELKKSIDSYKSQKGVSEKEGIMLDSLLKNDEALRFFPLISSFFIQKEEEVVYKGELLTREEIRAMIKLVRNDFEVAEEKEKMRRAEWEKRYAEDPTFMLKRCGE